jgi:hypothetical protein
MARLDDEIDLRVLDGVSKVAFGAVDLRSALERRWRRDVERLRAWQVTNPATSEQVTILVVAAALELVTVWFGRRR